MFIRELSTSQRESHTILWNFKWLFLPWLKFTELSWEQKKVLNKTHSSTLRWPKDRKDSFNPTFTSPRVFFVYYFEPVLNRVQMVGHIVSGTFYSHIITLYTSPGHIGSYFSSWGLFLIIYYNCKCLIFLLVYCMQWWILLSN